ncbi:MAG: MATE family efflux transporter [Alphaproteobacteria bacterium]|nr:MATE family efflux transporter [Alphaproteobacteria bacterium]
MIKDMRSGSPIKLILWFSLPVLLGNLFQQLYLMSDLLLVGRFLGMHSLAAVGTIMPFYGVLIMMSFGFTSGLSIIVAQRLGAEDYKGIARSFAAGIILSFLFCLFLMMVLPFVPLMLDLMNVPVEIFSDAVIFINTLLYGCVAMVFYNYLANVLRALGDSKTPLYFLIFSCVFNVLLNVWFIVGMGMGVRGSALGSVISQITSVILCSGLIYWKFPILKLTKQDFCIAWDWLYAHLRLAIPMTVQFSVIGLGGVIIQSVCNTFGTSAIAAMAASIRIEQFIALPLFSVGAAIVTFSAQNYGAKKINRIRQGVFQTSVFSLVLSFILPVVVYIWGGEMVQLFLEEANQEVIDLAHKYLKITTIFYCFLGQIFIFRQTLQGMGHSILPMFSGFVELFMRGFTGVVLASSYGYLGLCFASPAAWVGGCVILIGGYVYVLRHQHYHKTKKECLTWWPKSLLVRK